MSRFQKIRASVLKREDVEFRKNSRARRYVARVNEEGKIVVTVPSRGTQKEALVFANAHLDWLKDQQSEALKALSQKKPLSHGDLVLLEGRWEQVVISKDRGRPMLNVGRLSCFIANEFSDHAYAFAELLKAEAKAIFPDRLQGYAREFGLEVKRVSVRGQKTRWGSCSSSGTISLNWKLMQTPPDVLDYVIIHELMHIREMNHSERFWTLVADACPQYKQAMAWLNENGKWIIQ